MDNLTHSLAGWALAETGLKHRTRKGLAALVLAANMPDIDVFFGWVPWAPLAMHRGFTHGLVGGVLLMPPLLAGLLWLLDRWQVQRGRIAEQAPPMRIGWLVALCYLGALTHPLLDLQNVYAVQLMSPASERWFHTDGLFIVSPWLLAFLGLGIWLARRKGKGWPAGVAVGAAMGFILINIGISTLAGRALRLSEPYPAPDRVFASPEPLAFWRRDMIWRESGKITFGRYNPLRNPGLVTDRSTLVADNMDTVWAQSAAGKTPEAVAFLAWSQMPMARIDRSGSCATVTFGDARFTGPRLSRNFNVAVKDCAAGD
ncbi:MAG: metal-dependent hydrolase [Novosphingobium sp. 28-62-57]|uniref:metal-dependent hydrolase n=1 Tax=unclassified Novosphingobium TaxID=2644732 RepID=UPI000BD3EEAD|nr:MULTISPECIES: metal-dependent hydrolase [unclassified Novosphingobium]OYW49799.1 MAG: metal-dependent hydrolase [Novosphingobium sp. 12-62-10]OYZ39396.1 MAG: metal-dependent hydrolase [Novosphingobium sp. 16-62-11]OZA35734.1 MAG: metal-dependent hydrolase [Novosphingobium sp. 17-62-9]OYZ12245.1 MAG: metal-dependent hydrolase [Novosphingobium sp. 28-62-57]HQS69598.1 metal-dependent hydrolase [Novosphingobium sp.]